ncbi:MAG: bifunctional hydroxymethylpyrimidine kinase/phosphomethylpyrimidine kinase [Candidatus Koribacter versatilis]|uniref:hydroxymethylpyrimidine kinase n=1 Tax=Candidatus Korobacter versatilis TaxID=658062 RepID=A0A932A5Z3_9BACT|nr:bifunctional hydroxymethylpyrimidine kinase/phosphomethylpyrimidine kinase [Candidatus Koribacter versatilis]
MPPTPPIVLTIAGFDPSSGAGTTADIKTIAAHGCFGVGCITALTVQSTLGVRRSEPVSGKMIRDTLKELAADFTFAAVRIGMLGSADGVAAVVDFLKSGKQANVVLDPVIRSSSGEPLLDDKGVDRLRKELLPLATVITPNIDEAAALANMPVTNVEQMKLAAAALKQMGAKNVVVTGGHLDKPVDVLNVGGHVHEFASDRLRSSSTHGTGCAFATALACHLALGRDLDDAVVMSKAYVSSAIARAAKIGKGAGPVNHLYRMDDQPRPAQDAIEKTH